MEKKHYCKQTPKGEPLHCDFGFCHSCNSLPPVTPPIMEEKVGIEGIIYVLNNFRHDPARIAKTELYAKELLRLLNTEPTLSPDAMMLTDDMFICGDCSNISIHGTHRVSCYINDCVRYQERFSLIKATITKVLSLQKLAVEGK